MGRELGLGFHRLRSASSTAARRKTTIQKRKRMKHLQVQKKIGDQSYRLASPCDENREGMDLLADGDRFCHRCSKVVHNLDGKTSEEVQALFAAHGGRLCGAFTVRRLVAKPHVRLAIPPSIQANLVHKRRYFKQLAAMASFFLLAEGFLGASNPPISSQAWVMPAAEAGGQDSLSSSSHGEVDWSQNTIVSCIFTYEDSTEIGLNLEVSIFSRGVLITKTVAQSGFLKVDLAGKVKPEAMIGIVVGSNVAYGPEAHEEVYQHKGIQRVVRLRDAQNLVIPMEFETIMVEEMTYGGAMVEEVNVPPAIPVPEIIEIPVMGEVQSLIAKMKDGPKARPATNHQPD